MCASRSTSRTSLLRLFIVPSPDPPEETKTKKEDAVKEKAMKKMAERQGRVEIVMPKMIFGIENVCCFADDRATSQSSSIVVVVIFVSKFATFSRSISGMEMLRAFYDASRKTARRRSSVQFRQSPSDLLPCSVCSRKFVADRLEKHVEICSKKSRKKRKVFSSA